MEKDNLIELGKWYLKFKNQNTGDILSEKEKRNYHYCYNAVMKYKKLFPGIRFTPYCNVQVLLSTTRETSGPLQQEISKRSTSFILQNLKRIHFNQSSDLYGIATLIEFYGTTFDPVNAMCDFIKRIEYTSNYGSAANYYEMFHANDYLERITPDMLQSTINDPLLNATISFILRWNDESLINFGIQYNKYEYLVKILAEKRKSVPFYETITKIKINSDEVQSVPFLRCHIKILNNYFNHIIMNEFDYLVKPATSTLFSLNQHTSVNLKKHLECVLKKILDETITIDDVKLIENDTLFPNKFWTTFNEDDGRCIRIPYCENSEKAVTGQACCGKTRLLSNLREKDGWIIQSRGEIGSFAGKAKSPSTIAGLHEAIKYVLTRGDVVGDRCSIDNPLWSAIMPLCDTKYVKEDPNVIITELYKHLEGNVNENVLRSYARQNIVVFIDPYPSKNRERMLKRNTGGDAHRARILLYPVIQAIAYYFYARVCGWKVYCVPYDRETFDFDAKLHATIIKEVRDRFGKPKNLTFPTISRQKPNGPYDIVSEYPIASGIFK